MAQIAFKEPVSRKEDDGVPIYFSWPRTGASFTYQVSIDGGATYSAGSETIVEQAGDSIHDYMIPYSASERPSGAGVALFLVDDGTDSGRIIVTIEAAPVASTDGPTLSEYGPKRVKTKEMDIEQFDPETLQRLKEREAATTTVEFCGLNFCYGKR